MIKIKQILIFVMFPFVIFSQDSLRGKVLSAQTGEGLENVLIKAEGIKNVFYTDENGEFIIAVLKTFPVQISFKRLGYRDHIYTADNNAVLKIELEENLPGTDEIVVKGSLMENEGMLNSFYMNSGMNTIDELLSMAPGMSVIKRGNYASEPVFRGLNSDRMNITINGMKIQSACTDKMDPVTSYAETDNLESISVSKGSFSCSKCTDKHAGIDLKLKEAGTGNIMKLSGEFSAGYLSVSNGKKAESRFNFSSPGFGSLINFVYKTNGDYRTGNGETVNYSGFSKINAVNSNTFELSRKITVQSDFLYDFAWNIGYPALTMDVKSAKALIAGIGLNIKNLNGFLKGIDAKIYYNFVDHLMDDSKRDNRIKMDMPGKTDTKGAYVNGFFNLSGYSLGFKAEASLINARAEMTMYVPGSIPMFMLTWPDIGKENYTISLSAEKYYGSKFSASAGAWGSYIHSDINDILGLGELKIFYPSFSGTDKRNAGGVNAGINYMFSEKLNCGLSLGYSLRDLSVSEQYAFYIFNRMDGYDYIGNPYLDNEASGQAELNLKYTDGKTKITASVFTYQFTDYVTGIINRTYSPMTEGANGVKIYTNIPSARLTGFESVLETKLFNSIELINSVQYSYGTDNNGEYLPQIPPLSGALSVRYSKFSWRIQLESVWAAAQDKVNIQYGETRTPSSITFNFRGSVKVMKYVTIDAGAENIFDMNYYEHLDWLKLPRPGRNFYVSLKTTF